MRLWALSGNISSKPMLPSRRRNGIDKHDGVERGAITGISSGHLAVPLWFGLEPGAVSVNRSPRLASVVIPKHD